MKIFYSRLFKWQVIPHTHVFIVPARKRRECVKNFAKVSAVFCQNRKPLTPRRFRNQSSRFQLTQIGPRPETEQDKTISNWPVSSRAIFMVKSGKFTRLSLCAGYHQQWFVPQMENPYLLDNFRTTVSTSDVSEQAPMSPEESRIWHDDRRRAPTPTFLILRPLVHKPLPLVMTDGVFQIFERSVDLIVLPFDRSADAFKFYATHFPLLLRVNPVGADRTPSPKKRSRTPESPVTAFFSRKKGLIERLAELDYLLEVAEEETDDDCTFVTELRDETFIPTEWPWNKNDTSRLLKRYSIHEIMKL